MPFTPFDPRKLDVGEISPFGGILQNALKTYNNLTQSQYLDANLAEALKKARQYNQYYGPSMQSQMGLQGAQAANYGALTQAQNLTNQILPEKLQAELQKLKAEAQEKAFFNAMLQRKLSQGNANIQTGISTQPTDLSSYATGQGMPPYSPGGVTQGSSSMLGQPTQQAGMPLQPQNTGMQQQNTPVQQPGMPAQSPRTQNAADEASANSYYQDLSQQEPQPEPTIDDLLNKHFFAIDTFTPKLNAHIEQKKALKAATNKELTSIQHDVPVLINDLKDKLYIQEQIQSHPDWFGPGILGYDIHGPSYRERQVTNAEHGVLTDKFNTLVGKASTKLSSKSMAAALNYSIKNKVGFNNVPQEAMGRTQGVTENDARTLKQSDDFYYAKTGKHILRPVDRELLQKAFDSLEKNKVKVYFEGKVHRVPRSKLSNFRGKKGVVIDEKGASGYE